MYFYCECGLLIANMYLSTYLMNNADNRHVHIYRDVWFGYIINVLYYTGGWWYVSCFRANLNGQYCTGGAGDGTCACLAYDWDGGANYQALQNIMMRVSREWSYTM